MKPCCFSLSRPSRRYEGLCKATKVTTTKRASPTTHPDATAWESTDD